MLQQCRTTNTCSWSLINEFTWRWVCSAIGGSIANEVAYLCPLPWLEFLNTETIAKRTYKERDREGESQRVKEGVIFNVLWALLSEKSQDCKLCVCACLPTVWLRISFYPAHNWFGADGKALRGHECSLWKCLEDKPESTEMDSFLNGSLQTHTQMHLFLLSLF